MVDDDELLGVEEMMRNDERANRVGGGDATGVANHVGVARMQAQAVLEENAGVHTGEDRNVTFGADGEFAQTEIAREILVGF